MRGVEVERERQAVGASMAVKACRTVTVPDACPLVHPEMMPYDVQY